MRRTVAACLVWIVTATLSVVLVSPASAQGRPELSTDGNYCALNIDTGEIACVDDEADLQEARDAVLPEASTTAKARPGIALTSYLLGRFFDNASFNTAAGYIDFFGGAPCDAGLSPRDFGWSPMGAWANRISSFQGYSTCFIRIWSATGYTGSSLSYRSSEDNVGAVMNDQTESVEFS